MAERMVHCVKLNRMAPGLDKPPLKNELGQRVYDNVSKEGWKMFKDYFKMVMNEFQLNLADPATDRVFEEQMETFFFGEGAALPPDYVPPDPHQPPKH